MGLAAHRQCHAAHKWLCQQIHPQQNWPKKLLNRGATKVSCHLLKEQLHTENTLVNLNWMFQIPQALPWQNIQVSAAQGLVKYLSGFYESREFQHSLWDNQYVNKIIILFIKATACHHCESSLAMKLRLMPVNRVLINSSFDLISSVREDTANLLFLSFFFYKESLQCCNENIPLEGASSHKHNEVTVARRQHLNSTWLGSVNCEQSTLQLLNQWCCVYTRPWHLWLCKQVQDSWETLIDDIRSALKLKWLICCHHKGVAKSFSLPGEVSGQYSIVKDEDSAHLAHCQVAHSRHHGIPVMWRNEDH